MKIRIAIGLGGAGLAAAEFAELVASLAELGFDSLWVSSKFVLRPVAVRGSWRGELAGLAGAVGDLQT